MEVQVNPGHNGFYLLGFPPLTGTGTIHVLVDDVNDNEPVFDADKFITFISEDEAIGTIFATITATDKDAGVNGQIR